MSYFKNVGTKNTVTVQIPFMNDGGEEVKCRVEIKKDSYFERKRLKQELSNTNGLLKCMTPEFAKVLQERSRKLEAAGDDEEKKRQIEEEYAQAMVGTVDLTDVAAARQDKTEDPEWIKKNLIEHVTGFWSPPTEEFPEGEEEIFEEIIDLLPDDLVEALDLKVKEINKIGKRFTEADRKNS